MSAPQAAWPAPGLYSEDQCQPGVADAYLDHELCTAIDDFMRRHGFDETRQRIAEILMDQASGARHSRRAA